MGPACGPSSVMSPLQRGDLLHHITGQMATVAVVSV
jgi:hypothetical protein